MRIITKIHVKERNKTDKMNNFVKFCFLPIHIYKSTEFDNQVS